MHFYAIDPPGLKADGKSMSPMGICTYETDSRSLAATQIAMTLPDFLRWLSTTRPRPTKLIIEPFTFRKDDQGRAKIDYTPAEYVGVATAYCGLHRIPVLRQQASVAVGSTAFWGDSRDGNAKLRQIGVWDPFIAPHGIDALRHMLYYLTFKMGDDFWLRKLKP